jgi:hypothetical protein
MDKGTISWLMWKGHDSVEISIVQWLTLREFATVLKTALDMPGAEYYTFRELGEKLSWDELNSRERWPVLYSKIQKTFRTNQIVKWSLN